MSREPEIVVPDHIPPIAMAELDEKQQDKLGTIAHHVRGILTALGLDLKDPNLAETDIRVAKMYLEMFGGLAEGAILPRGFRRRGSAAPPAPARRPAPTS